MYIDKILKTKCAKYIELLVIISFAPNIILTNSTTNQIDNTSILIDFCIDFPKVKVIKRNIIMSSDYMRNYMKQRRKNRRQKFIDLLGGKCVSCGSTENLQFDHQNAKKKTFDINSIKDGKESIILKELKKCVLLCPSCHLNKTKDNKEHINKDKKPARHGTLWMYKKYKCRCPKCQKAMSLYNKQLK